MPPPRKIDKLPSEVRIWLQDQLKEQGFSGYVELTDALNEKLVELGIEETVGKSAVHSFGQEYEVMARAQEEASQWAVSWMEGNGLEEEAKRHNVLFQMITTLAFKVMKSAMMKDGDEIDPKELHFLGKMLKDVMSSSGIREKVNADERERVAKEAVAKDRAAMAKRLDEAGEKGDHSLKEALTIARDLMGLDP